MARQADAHQLDVIAQEVHFGLERYRRPAAGVEYVPQQAAQVVHRLDVYKRQVQQRVKYPAIAQENGIQGKVIISFVVNTDCLLYTSRCV